MFTFLVVAAWTLVIIAGVLLLLLASLPFIGGFIFSNNFTLNIIAWLTSQPFSLPFFRVTTVAGPEEYLVEGPFNSWVITPIGIVNAAAGGEFSEGALTALSTYTLVGVFVVIALGLIGIAISELVRLRKRQKISKPFVKILLVLFPVLGLLYGQVIILIASGLLLISLFLLEGVLLDPEAVNNYAEERNLITIYHEEKKFEKEVSKEGKLIGNIDLVTVRKRQNALNQNEERELNSNSMLPKGSTKWRLKHEMLVEKKTSLEKDRDILKNKISELGSSDRITEIQKYDEKVQEINDAIVVLGLNEEKEIFWEELEKLDINKTSISEFEKIKLTKEYLDWKQKFDALAIKKIELEIKSNSNKKNIKKIMKFNAKCEVLNECAKSIGLKSDYYLLPIILETVEQNKTNNIESKEILLIPSNNEKELDSEEGNLDFIENNESLTKTSLEENIQELLKTESVNPTIILETTDVETIYKDKNFTPVNLEPDINKTERLALHSEIKSDVISEPAIINSSILNADENIQEEQDTDNVEKEIDTSEIEMTREEVNKQVKNRMEMAINMDLSDLQTTNQSVNADSNSIYKDINFERKEFSNLNIFEEKKVEKPEIVEVTLEQIDNNDLFVTKDLHSDTSSSDSINLSKKFEKVEERITKLENIIEDLREKDTALFKNEVDSLNQKIKNISKNIEEIKNSSSPRKIIDTLTKKHIYNQK